MNSGSSVATKETSAFRARIAGFLAWGTTVVLLLTWAVAMVVAQESPDIDEPGLPAGESEPGQDIHPDAVSRFVTRTYKTSPKALWNGLLSLLEESGYPVEEVDGKEMVVKTRFIDFKSTDYSEEVGEAQPRVSDDYTILQMRRVKVGKVSLEAAVSRSERGTDINIRARILVQGLDRKQNVLLLTDRRSSGVIEADFLRLLEDRLELERL
ncbi:MAG TPA: hypothetical protein VFG08_00205 [Candidatus Polarisedimenticolia bacterium]|nr:hypothetical protein [Candidatus Polarisedimenticolia bacterium]